MPVQITIIGLRQIGASIGLTLKARNTAQKMGAVDRGCEKMDVPAFGKQLSRMFFGSSDRDRIESR